MLPEEYVQPLLTLNAFVLRRLFPLGKCPDVRPIDVVEIIWHIIRLAILATIGNNIVIIQFISICTEEQPQNKITLHIHTP